MNRTNRFLAFALLLLVGTTSVTLAQTMEVDYARFLAEQDMVSELVVEPVPEPVKVSCGVKFASAYVLDIGVRATASGEGALQGSCTASNSSGIYGGVWFSQSTKDPGVDKTGANEVDLYSGLVITKGRVKMDVGVQYFDLVNPELFDGQGDFFNPFVNLSFLTEGKVHPYLNFNGLVGTDSSSFPEGWYIKGGVVYDFALGDVPLAFNLSGTHNEGVAGFTADILRVSLAAPLKIHGRTVTPSVSHSHPLGNETQVKNETWFTVATNF